MYTTTFTFHFARLNTSFKKSYIIILTCTATMKRKSYVNTYASNSSLLGAVCALVGTIVGAVELATAALFG